jgi:hypothetical protein
MRLVSSVNSVDLKTGLRVKEFTSPTTAATAIGISRLEISQCCRGLLDEAIKQEDLVGNSPLVRYLVIYAYTFLDYQNLWCIL